MEKVVMEGRSREREETSVERHKRLMREKRDFEKEFTYLITRNALEQCRSF